MKANTDNNAQNNFDIKDYRQPMIASLGIIMGFLLNFLAGWAIETDTMAIQTTADWVVIMTIVSALVLMFTVLYGLLTPFQPKENVQFYYLRIFRLYLLSLTTAFIGIMAALFI